jgi:hypothetical protein
MGAVTTIGSIPNLLLNASLLGERTEAVDDRSFHSQHIGN